MNQLAGQDAFLSSGRKLLVDERRGCLAALQLARNSGLSLRVSSRQIARLEGTGC